MTPLKKHATEWLNGRIRRGELTWDSARMPRVALDRLCAVHGNRPVNQLTEATIERWLETVADLAPATRRNYLGCVRAFCRHLVRRRHLRVDPCVDIDTPRQPRQVVHVVNRDEMGALWSVCTTPRDRALVALAFELGLRCIEISRLNVDDFDWRNRCFVATGKGGHERTLPLTEHIARIIRGHIALDPRSSGALFPSPSGRLRAGTISGRISELMYRAGVKTGPFDGKSAHALRRTAATETLEASGDLGAVQALLGHADLSSLRHYIARTETGRIAAAVESRWEGPDAA